MKKSVIVVVCLLLVGIFGWSIAKANSADIKVHLGAGTIVMDQQELVLTPDEAIMVQEDTVYLPLRPLMEKMDYQVFWDAGMQNVSMEKGDQTYFCYCQHRRIRYRFWCNPRFCQQNICSR